ncbi:MAG: YicC/YloC family endoribonuclease [Flavobacteriales bacterium]
MIYSMTGFGRATAETSDKKITVELRSLNSKQLDLNLRLPGRYREKEGEIRKLVSSVVERGKVDLSIHVESTGVERSHFLNKDLILAYYNEVKFITDSVGDKSELMPSVLRFPEVFKTDNQELNEEEWHTIEDLLNAALNNFVSFREEEGKSLSNELLLRKNNIIRLLAEVERYELGRIKTVRDRIQKALDESVGGENVDQNRLEQELIYYVEKLDVTEEKVRLKKHCEYFEKTLHKEDNSGRKLGFICQEMGREINTLGSKANHAEIQQLVVQMKDDLEKIKEQVLNVL